MKKATHKGTHTPSTPPVTLCGRPIKPDTLVSASWSRVDCARCVRRRSAP